MIPTDDAAHACSSATMFHDARVAQFWDPERLSSRAWSVEFQVQQARAALDSMSPEDPKRPLVEGWVQDPASVSVWDVAYFYPPHVRWRDRIPSPAAWTEQLSYWGRGSSDSMDTTSDGNEPQAVAPGATTGKFWRHDRLRALVESDWRLEFEAGMRSVAAQGPAAAAALRAQ